MTGRSPYTGQAHDLGPLFPPRAPPGDGDFVGADYVAEIDRARLSGQIGLIFGLMSDGRWRTLADISTAVDHCGEASASAQLRNLRKPGHGGHVVERRRRHELCGLYEYRLVAREPHG